MSIDEKSKPKAAKKVKTQSSPSNVRLVASEGETVKSRVRVKEEDFMRRLTEKLTHFDASLVLEAAMLSAGVSRSEGFLKKEETRTICLELIKRGGPAFSVGAGIYREVIG